MTTQVFAFLVVATGATLAVLLGFYCLYRSQRDGYGHSQDEWRWLAAKCLGAAACFLGAWWLFWG